VLASTAANALVFQQIKKAYNDSQIVDMEAYGFLHACRAEKVPHSMVIRGVSDLLQKKEESDKSGNQPLAASNAAAFVFALIRLCPEIIKPKKRKKLFGKS
jgi:nucleoside phosphorylase